MPFVWVNDPKIPESVPAPIIGPTEVSTEVHVVANTVNVSPILGTVSYNTHNVGYDVIYALPSLNVHDLHVTHLQADNIQVHLVASINTATINIATINTANIVSATIANGVMGVNPTSNGQIATKEYVDSIIANSTPAGGNLQLLIQAAGDLLVGVSDNTAARLPVGNADQVLAVGGSGNTGVHWVGPLGSSGSTRGLVIGTNWDAALKNTQIQLVSVDEIVMEDGVRVPDGWNGLTASINQSGVGGIDTGTVIANTCYEVYAIRNSSSGAQGLLLHRALDREPDIHRPTSAVVVKNLNVVEGQTRSTETVVAQSFVAHKTGPFVAIDLTLGRTGNAIGNVFVTLESNGADGNSSGTILATSRKYSAGRIGFLESERVRVKFPFDTPATVTNGTLYWAVIRTDYAQGNLQTNPNYLGVYGQSDNSYTEGSCKFINANTIGPGATGWAYTNSAFQIDGPQGPTVLYFRTFIEANSTAVVMPAGYDQKCLISYCSTTHRFFLREYHQQDRRMMMAFHYTWCYHSNGGLSAPKSENPGANNSPLVQFPEPVHMGEMVPPVPCIVWIFKYTGLTGTATVSAGNLKVTDIGVQTFSEGDGYLNTSIAANQQQFLGPLFVEYSAHMNHAGGAPIQMLYVAGIEF